MGAYKKCGAYFEQSEQHIAADVGMVNYVLNIMKGKIKELIFLENPLWARYMGQFRSPHDRPRDGGVYLRFPCGSLRLGLFTRIQAQTLPLWVC